MHTFLSDGTPSPTELVRACIDLQLDEISITDHDSIGAYPEVFEVAKGSKLHIVVGAELDCTYQDLEIHMLAFGLDIMNVDLNDHLAFMQKARKKRAKEQADAINRYHKKTVVDLEKICARCQTFMNPHLIHAMINQGLFDTFAPPDRYKQAQSWLRQHIQVQTVIKKPGVEEMLSLIHKADGIAVLAHPGYYLKNGLDVRQMVKGLKDAGMNGIETVYPYCQEGSREFPTLEDEREAIAIIQDLAREFELQETTGSDAHHLDQLRMFHSRS
jgi:predicted metal-dependent phosphoesterase TrpH